MQIRLKLTDKGHLVLTKELLAQLGVRPGDTLIADTDTPGVIKVRTADGIGIEPFFGCLKNDDGIHLTIDEFNEAISDAWAGKR